MKKLLSIMLVLALMMTMFTACSNIRNDKNDDDEPEEITLEETVVYNSNDITITVNEMDDGFMGPEFQMTIVNNSDRNIALSTDECIVNGITVGGFGYIQVPAGDEVEDSIYIYQDELDVAGIETIATLNFFNAHIVDNDTYETLYETPIVLTTSAGEDFEQDIYDSGDVIFEIDRITVIAHLYDDSSNGKTVYLLVKNESGKEIVVETEEILVNGTEVSAWVYDTVYDGTVRYCDLDLFTSNMEELDIEKIEEVTVSLSIIDSESYSTIAESERITIPVA